MPARSRTRPDLPGTYPGPYCWSCKDLPGDDCECLMARCIVPGCGRRVSEAAGAPVPISWLMTPRPGGNLDLPEADLEWACSAKCLFAFLRASEEGREAPEAALSALERLSEMRRPYEGYFGSAGRTVRRVEPYLARDQMRTLNEAARIAHMASAARS